MNERTLLYQIISLKILQFNVLLVLHLELEVSLIVKDEIFERSAYNVLVILFIVLLDLEVALVAKDETIERSAYYKTFDYNQIISQKNSSIHRSSRSYFESKFL